MMMNKLYTVLQKAVAITLLLIIFSSKLSAQSEPMYSQYMFNMMSANPAYAGSRGALGLNFFSRNQWTDIPGAPNTKDRKSTRLNSSH